MTGIFFNGWLTARQLTNVPTYYMVCGNDPVDLEWLRKTRTEKAAAAFLVGELSVPGSTNDVP
eukprot:10855700-Lingulodinium_polyedra.AAC.1